MLFSAVFSYVFRISFHLNDFGHQVELAVIIINLCPQKIVFPSCSLVFLMFSTTFPSCCMYFHLFSCAFMVFHQFPCLSMYFMAFFCWCFLQFSVIRSVGAQFYKNISVSRLAARRLHSFYLEWSVKMNGEMDGERSTYFDFQFVTF